jgi:putative sigma-54 modulation protein
MQVNVSARHGNLQPGDQPLVVEKVEKLRRLYDRTSSIDVTIDLKQLAKPSIEIKVSVEGSDDCLATAESNTVISAIDLAIPKVEQQLRRIKEKKTGHRATPHKHIEPMVADDE